MHVLQELSGSCVHWSLGLTVLVGITASEFSGVATMIAIPLSAISITLSALSGASFDGVPESAYKKRKFCDILEFFTIWMEVLEILAASATCARVASATIDYISSGRFREWFLGLESHSLGEPWPDVLGVSVVIVVTGLFMLGLEKSPMLTALLLVLILSSHAFFMVAGGDHSVLGLSKWAEDFQNISVQSVLSATTLCSFGFTNTFPKIINYKVPKIIGLICIPIVMYSTTVLMFTLMCNYKELSGTATPMLKVFEIRDVDWARLVMAICIICISCLALTESLPSLYGIFVLLASKEWQIFLGSLQYRNSLTGAPMLAIFAAGSLAAILAFACPLAYLVKILNTACLLKCVLKALHTLYKNYKPVFSNDAYLVNSNTQYSKLKQSSRVAKEPKWKDRIEGCFSGWKKKSSGVQLKKAKKPNTNRVVGADDEYLLLDDYCDKSAEMVLDASSEESDEKESVLSSDVEDSYSSTDIDAVVQEYKDKVQVATIDNFKQHRNPSQITATIVALFVFVIILSSVCISRVIASKRFGLLWICIIPQLLATIAILALPKSRSENELLPRAITPLFSLLSMELNIVLLGTVLGDVWLGFLFWFFAGCLLFWRCDCCTCEGLVHSHSDRLNITENISQVPTKYVDTILVAR